MSAGSKIGRKQETAIAAWLTTRTHAEAAVAAGISEATLQRWLRLPGFVAAYRTARRAVVETAIGQLQRCASVDAVAALARNLNCGNPSVEIRAAATILTEAVKGVELMDPLGRMDELEALFAAREEGTP